MKHTIPRKTRKSQNTIAIFSLIILIIILFIISIPVFGFENLIIESTLIETNKQLLYALIFLWGYVLITYISELFKSYQEIKLANISLRIISPWMQVLFVLIFSISIATVTTILLGMALGLIISIVLSTYLIAKYTSFSFEFDYSKNLIIDYGKYLGPTGFAAILTGVQFSIYNVLMFSITSIGAGVFGIALIIAFICRIPLSSVNQSFPQIASVLYQENKKSKIDRLLKSTSKIALLFSLSFVIVVATYHNEIAQLFATEYVTYSIIFPIVAIGQTVAVMCGTVGYMILMTDNEKGYLILQVFITIIILSFTIPLTYHYGVVGLGISYALGFSINNLIELGFLYNREKLIAVTRNDLYMTLLSIPLTIISVLFNQFMTLLISAILTFIIVIIFYLTVYKKLLNEKEQNAIKYIYNRIKL